MGLSDIPAEIRLCILSELLVLSEPIIFTADLGPSSASLLRRQRHGLCPAVLRVSKLMHDEGSPLLYSENRFCFPEVWINTPSVSTSAYVRPFLHQIDSNAKLLRHICIPFPTFEYSQRIETVLHQAHIESAELIRDTCTGVKTLELLVPPDHDNYVLNDPVIEIKAWDVMDAHFRTIPSISDIIVHFQVYPLEDPSDDVKQEIHKYGWIIKVTKLPAKVWISVDDRVAFDNEDDCNAYNEEQLRLEWAAEQAEEEAMWLQEYHQRRNDPYWKNDSDYD